MNEPMTIPLNHWRIGPLDTGEDPHIKCFFETNHYFYDISTGGVVSYINVISFDNGVVEIDT